ncbi:MAG: hypothetical protein K6E13_03115 [Lachnospiraceae bacterium]|nr:hypothetical protein [Lachnospiraceae bacterium]
MKTYEEGYRDGYDGFMKLLYESRDNDNKLARLKRTMPSGSRSDAFKEGYRDGWKAARNEATNW